MNFGFFWFLCFLVGLAVGALTLNDKQKQIIGKWQVESQEGVDEYLKAIGIGFFLRSVAGVQKPNVKFEVEGDNIHMSVESAFKDADWTFTPGKKFNLTTIDGRHFLATISLDESGKLTEKQEITPEEPDNIPSTIERNVQNGKLVVTEKAPTGETSTRTFTRVQQ